MLKVYRLEHDPSYRRLESGFAPGLEQPADRTFDGRVKGAAWQPGPVRAEAVDRPAPDIWWFNGTMAFESHAASVLMTCLYKSCEQRTVPFEERSLTLVNVGYVINVLNRAESTRGATEAVEKYQFYGHRMDYPLFKIPETRESEILTVQGVSVSGDEFKPLVASHKLSGLRFKLLWSGPGRNY